MPAIVLSLAVLGCAETDTTSTDSLIGDLQVTPVALQFGSAEVGASVLRTVTLRNVGTGPIEVTSVATDDAAFVVLPAFTGATLGADTDLALEVGFTADGLEHAASLTVTSDDPDSPSIVVALEGDTDLGSLVGSPSPVDVNADVPCRETVAVGVRNDGDATVTVEELVFVGDPRIVLDDLPDLPLDLGPGQDVNFELEFRSDVAGTAAGEIVATSNDPLNPTLRIPVTATAGYEETVTDSYFVPLDAAVDILFAVDTSCSMGEDSVQLSDEFGAFIDAVSEVTEGWRIGVVNQELACFTNGIIDAATPNYQAVFSDAVTTVIQHGFQEKLLFLSDSALENTAPGLCNEGFLRNGALLNIIVVSDEADSSPGDWSDWVTGYESYVADPSLLKVSGILNVYNVCGTGNGATGYLEAVEATGGVVLDICDEGWGSDVDELAIEAVEALTVYPLSQTPYPGSVTVLSDGLSLLSGWGYDEAQNAVIFEDNLVGGETLSIVYGLTADCY